MLRVRRRLALTLAIAAAMVVAVPTGAGAKTELNQREKHCVVYVTEKTVEGELKMSEPTCAKSREGAAEIASRPIYKPQSADIDGMAFGLSNFTIGIHYNGRNGTGSSITVVGSSCTGGYWNTPTWFDNKESSVYNGCYRLRHFNLPNMGGSATNTYGVGQTDNISAWMNNRTESVSYHSS